MRFDGNQSQHWWCDYFIAVMLLINMHSVMKFCDKEKHGYRLRLTSGDLCGILFSKEQVGKVRQRSWSSSWSRKFLCLRKKKKTKKTPQTLRVSLLICWWPWWHHRGGGGLSNTNMQAIDRPHDQHINIILFFKHTKHHIKKIKKNKTCNMI